MSIWGPAPFENDDAVDWFGDFADRPSLTLIREALEELADPTHVGFIDIADGGEAIAAAFVLANLLGDVSGELDLAEEKATTLKAEWLSESLRARKKLVQYALTSLQLVLYDEENSELRQIWEGDAAGMTGWTEELMNLQEGLLSIAGSLT